MFVLLQMWTPTVFFFVVLNKEAGKHAAGVY